MTVLPLGLPVAQPGSPEWWLHRLTARLQERKARLDKLDRYSIGDHDLPEGDARVRETFQRFQRKARTNYTGLVATSVSERLHVNGFQYGDSRSSDAAADRIWQANNLDAESGLVHHAACVFSTAYVIVGPPEQDVPLATGLPLITPEDPRQVIVERDPKNSRRIRAGLKVWSDEVENLTHAIVYLPNSITYFQSESLAPEVETLIGGRWERERADAGNPLGIVPIVPFAGRRFFGRELGEFEDVIDVQDRINGTVLDRLVISKMQAYRQRWVKGITIEHDAEGKPIAPFRPGVDLLWTTENDQAAFGDFQESDVTQLLSAIRDDIKDLAAVSRTPPHYLLGELVNVSADALDAAETGLVAKVKERMRFYGESWEQVMRLAFRYLGDERANVVDARTLWASPKRITASQAADAAVKKAAAGVPWEQRMTDLDYEPQQIDRMKAERAEETLMQGLLQPQPPTQQQPPAA